MDFNAAIRTLCIAGHRAMFHAGGCIVADSNEGDEHAELMLDARPLLDALGGC
jgi:anthranilate/para-aminobenzoate synthase component I